jgi:hypothetical protein
LKRTMTSPPAPLLELTAPLPLVLDLLGWVSTGRRTYRETMDAWRTSCPRLPVWEDALDSGLVEVTRGDDGDALRVAITPEGRTLLASHRR